MERHFQKIDETALTKTVSDLMKQNAQVENPASSKTVLRSKSQTNRPKIALYVANLALIIALAKGYNNGYSYTPNAKVNHASQVVFPQSQSNMASQFSIKKSQ